MHDVTSATAKILQLEQKRLLYGTRPFLLLRRVWLARLHHTSNVIYIYIYIYIYLAHTAVPVRSLSVCLLSGLKITPISPLYDC